MFFEPLELISATGMVVTVSGVCVGVKSLARRLLREGKGKSD